MLTSLLRASQCALTCTLLFGFLAASPAHADGGDPLVEQRDVQGWLKKIQSAAQKLNYAGTFVYQQANQVRASRITHFVDGRNELEKLEILDGRPREYIRSNEDITCYIPENRSILVEKRTTPEFFPGMLAANATEIAEHYDVKKGEGGRVAGYEFSSIELTPRDNLRYGYRLWTEKNSGLLLRAQIINERHEVVEQITFAQVVIGGIDKNSVRPTFANTFGWHVENVSPNQSYQSGWSVNAVPPGFAKIHEIRRSVPNAPANLLTGGGPPGVHDVSQLVFSDGLAAISVFVEPSLQNRVEGPMQQGAMNIIGKRQGDFWLTVVGEVPAAAIRQVANSIEFKSR
ncbi:MAG: MucB/RseB C-terminal domain-containing protein [Burkholderiaceae bacterium]|nr:MucB/RseB C-terminal domain-containing protein [Burkholderiaceae bacterium]